MSVPVSLEMGDRLPWYRQAGPRFAVGIARLLAMLPPARLQRVLQALSVGARPGTYDQALRARRAAVGVSARCAGLGCLQRSVAVVIMCRMRGRWPDWCTGFRTQPFAAHAWVEVDGMPVDEPGDLGPFKTVLAVRRPVAERG